MPSAPLSSIDWSRPWYASVLAAATDILAGDAPIMQALNTRAARQGLRTAADMPLAFVAQAALPSGVAYESFIAATGCVPTRENLHDFFNALVWFSFPRVKRQLNALQAAQIALSGVGQARGQVRDAITIFDENAALLLVRRGQAGTRLVEALRQHQWCEVFIDQRHGFCADAEVCLFGHALMEKLVSPYKAITAHTIALVVDDDYFGLTHAARLAWIDQHLAQKLADHGLRGIAFTPLPIAAIPGWWQDQNLAFYQDTLVFRPKRHTEI